MKFPACPRNMKQIWKKYGKNKTNMKQCKKSEISGLPAKYQNEKNIKKYETNMKQI